MVWLAVDVGQSVDELRRVGWDIVVPDPDEVSVGGGWIAVAWDVISKCIDDRSDGMGWDCDGFNVRHLISSFHAQDHATISQDVSCLGWHS